MRTVYLIAWGITRMLGNFYSAITEPILRANDWCAKRLNA